MSRAALADALNRRLRRGVFSGRSIEKIERGEPVDGFRLRPVLIALGLEAPLTLDGPTSGESPGSWLRRVREAHGISPNELCGRAQYPQYNRRLSRTTLAAYEADEKIPGWFVFDALEASFRHFGVAVAADSLWRVWDNADHAAAAAIWEPQIVTFGDAQIVGFGAAQLRLGDSAAATAQQVAPLPSKSTLPAVARRALAGAAVVVPLLASLAKRNKIEDLSTGGGPRHRSRPLPADAATERIIAYQLRHGVQLFPSG